MKAPWANKTGAARSATVLGISMGLCGVNWVAFATLPLTHVDGFPSGTPLSTGLIITAYIESAGILVGSGGLLIALVFGLWELVSYLTKKEDSE